ncbi:MAG: prepilin-type N-terminal cleavage/methylation domain-containing protein [bacterium]|nr:prepilin-type N-terminal cleavage/methylation domain-containing protein [bacterium]
MLKAQLNKNKTESGQSLIEILIGIAIGAILIGGAAATITLTLRSNVQNKNIQTASSLSQAILDKVTVYADADWHNIDGVVNCGTTGVGILPSPASYHLASEDYLPGLECKAGAKSEPVDAEGITFSTSFKIEPAHRNQATDAIEPASSSTYEDPSTKKIVSITTWLENGQEADVTVNKYITRSRNLIFKQTDWQGGKPPQETFPDGGITVNTKFSASAGVKFSEAGVLKKSGF